jgi:hypothetical protein
MVRLVEAVVAVAVVVVVVVVVVVWLAVPAAVAAEGWYSGPCCGQTAHSCNSFLGSHAYLFGICFVQVVQRVCICSWF